MIEDHKKIVDFAIYSWLSDSRKRFVYKGNDGRWSTAVIGSPSWIQLRNTKYSAELKRRVKS